MANNSPTIVAASLSDDQLKKSIDSLVTHVDEAMKKMVQSTNNAVGEMEAKLKSLGNLKIDSGGAADGGSSKRTKSLSEESLKAKEVAMSYDQMQSVLQRIAKDNSGLKDIRTFNKEELQSYIDLLRKLQAEYVRVNTQEGGGVKSDKIKQDVAELEKIIQGYQTILRNVEAINSRQGTIDVKKWTQDIGAVDDRYKKLVRWYTVLEKEDQRRIANEEKANQKRLTELDKEEKARQKMIESARKAEEKYQNAVLKTAFNKIIDLPSNNIDQMRTKLERLQTILANIRELGVLSPKDISSAETEIGKLRGNIQQIEKIERERVEAERRFVVEQAKEIEQTQTLEGRIKSLAQIARERIKEEQSSYTDLQAYGKAFRVFDASSPFAKGLSIEEQIKNALTEEKTAREGVSQAAQQQANSTQNVAKANQGESEVIRKNFRDYDSLRQAIASVLGIKSENIRLLGAEVSSINVLSDRLKQLRTVYNQLGTDDRHSETGKALILQIQNIEHQMDRARKELSRPIDLKSALSTSEKTLDDIAYKMQRLASYRSGLNVETQKKEISTVNAEYDRLKKKMDEVMQKNQSMIASNNALGRSWNYMKNRLAFYFTVGASTQFIKNLIEVRSQYEMNEKALGILLDSASRGTRIFNELSQMSLVSPYTLIELSSAAKQLTAYDIAAKDVVDTTRRLADMASAVGIPVERLTYALGQIKAYGYLNSRDARMFANAGIPLVKQLSDYYSELEGKMVSTADVYDRMKKKAIDYNDVMKVVTKMTDEGGKFFDFQAKMADTLKVRLANLTLAWNNMLNDLGKSNQGGLNTSIKSLTIVFRHWREIYRVLSTLIVALGAYKIATIVAGMTTKSSIGGSAVASWLSLARGVKSAKDAVSLFSLTVKSIPFTGWVTMIATLASYFFLFNNSTDGLKQKLEDIAAAFDGVRKEITDLYADALKSDSIGSQLTKLRDMLELAQTELGVTIPIKLEEVNEGNVKQKLREVKNIIDDYLYFSQEFSEAAAGTKFNELMNKFGANARSTYTGISESINTVVVALQNLVDKGNASKRDLEILNELTSGQKEDESRIEYLQRLVRLYEELGLVGKKVTTPSVSFFSSSTDNMNELTEKQNEQLDRLGIKNKQVFENMLKDVQGYYSSSSIAQYQFEQQVERVAKRIDINNIPVEQRTLKLSAAINEEASQNNWNQFEKEFARQVANQKFGTQIEISEESKSVAEQDLKDWQKKQQEWAAKNGITIPINFQTNDTEISYAKRMLQAAIDAKEEVEVQQRKLAVGTGSQDAVDTAKKAYENARILAKNAGADLEQLDKKANSAAKKAAKAAESELAKAIKDELSTIDKVRSIYKDLTKEGMSHADAVERATKGWDETIKSIDNVLQKNGLGKLDLTKFAGISNPRELVNMLQSQLDALVKRGANATDIKELQTKIQTLKVDAEKYDLTKITKGLNNELDRLKEEYELAVELDANPELGGMFADMFGINTNTLPQTFGEALDRAQIIINRKLAEMKISTPFDLMQSNVDDFAKSTGLEKEGAVIKELVSAQNSYRDMFKKNITETEKMLDDYIKKYGDYSDKIAEIEANRLEKLKKLNEAYYTEEMRKRPEYIAKLNAIEQGASREKSNVEFDAFKNSRYYTMMFENLDYVSTKTIRDMRDYVRELIDTMNDLTPEQLKTLMSQYEKLEQKLVKRSPFKTLTKDLKNYLKTSGNRKAANEAFRNAQKEYDAQEKNVAALKEKYEQAKANTNTSQSYLDFLQIEINGENEILKILKEQLDAAEKKADKYNLTAKLAKSEALQVAQVVAANLKGIAELRDQMNELFGIDASKGETLLGHELDGVIDGLSRASDGISKIVSSAQGGNVFGVVSGAVDTLVGIGDSIASIFGDGSARTKRLNKEINKSKETVRQLGMAYDDLERAVEKSLGTSETEAKRAAIANKELQLAELERQKTLEESKRSKDRDDDAIKQYEENIHSLRNEINDLKEEVVNNLWGDDVKSAAEAFIDTWVSAWKAGKTTLKDIKDEMNDIMLNIVKKGVSSKIVEGYLSPIYKELDRMTKSDSKGGVALTNDELKAISDMSKTAAVDINNALKALYGQLDLLGVVKPDNNLSALQQGIQGVTEDTAGAIEAYMNGVSQQVYLQSDLLTQIRDAVVGLDIDVQTATMGEILLQLRSSYEVQMAIHGILEGVLTPSGQGFRVELLS